jgi:hypothetical protein
LYGRLEFYTGLVTEVLQEVSKVGIGLAQYELEDIGGH